MNKRRKRLPLLVRRDSCGHEQYFLQLALLQRRARQGYVSEMDRIKCSAE